MSLTYQDIHWEDNPRKTTDMHVVTGRLKPIAEVETASYTTRKGGESQIWEHEFDSHECHTEGRKRKPYLLIRDEDGGFQSGKPPKSATAIGRALDLRTTDGKRVILEAGAWLITDDQGKALWLAWKREPVADLEKRKKGPRVERAGIVA